MCLLATMGISATSCGQGSDAKSDSDTLVSVAKSDSLSQYYGLMAGSFIGGELSYYAKDSGEAYDRNEFVKGLQSVVGLDKSDAYLAGMNTGMRVLQDLKGMEKQGVQVNRDILLKELRKMILADSINKDESQEYSRIYQDLMQEVQAQAQAREEARKANSPEAKANVKAGEEYLAKVKGLKKTKDGLGYVMINEGEGEPIKDGDRVTINYKGRHLNGIEFDKGEGSVMQPGQNLIVGFSEGVKLLKKGGKITIYVPGHLGYGANGVPHANIGPNEMLIFDIEVLDVNPEVKPQDNDGQIK